MKIYDADGLEKVNTIGTDNTAIHDNVAGEIAAITEKVAPVSGDLLVIEDSAASNVKKRVQIGNLPIGGAGSDTTAIHDNVAAEISAITEKIAPIGADLLVIEDSAAGNAKKRVQIGNLPSGGGGDNVSVNGVAAADADFDDTTPAADTGGDSTFDGLNVKWQKDAGTPNNVSAWIGKGSDGTWVIGFSLVGASAVNYVGVQNALAGSKPSIHARGTEADISLALSPKGTGRVYIGDGSVGSPAAFIEQVAPGTPPANQALLYAKDKAAVSSLYFKDDAGVEHDLGAGAGAVPTGTGFRHITAGAEDAAAKLVDTADINADQVTYAKIQNVSVTDKVLGRATAGAGNIEEIDCTAAGRALIDDASAEAQRTTLGLPDGTNNFVLRMGVTDPAYEAELLSKDITIEAPTASEDITFFYTPIAITVTEVRIVHVGTSPSVTLVLKHATDRSAAGTDVTTSAAFTNTTTGATATLSDATIPAGSYVWIETTAQSGTVNSMAIHLRYTVD